MEYDEELNVDILESILDSLLPSKNKSSDEEYDELIQEIGTFKVIKQGHLQEIIKKHLAECLKEDKRIVNSIIKREGDFHRYENIEPRTKKGVFYSHAGILRKIMSMEFGEPWKTFLRLCGALQLFSFT